MSDDEQYQAFLRDLDRGEERDDGRDQADVQG